MPMKILLLGSSGMLGQELARQLIKAGQSTLQPKRDELDLSLPQQLERYLLSHRPELIINAAAYTQVDQAEQEPEQAWQLNAQLPKQLAEYCQEHQAKLMHYSTDYVYSGEGTEPWVEQSATQPLNQYGASKLAGDQAIMASDCEYWIFRTSWVFAPYGKNFMTTMLKLADKDELRIVDDQIGAPTSTRLLAEVSLQAIQSFDFGLYHLCSTGHLSWYQFAERIFTQAQSLGLINNSPMLQPCTSAEYPTLAQRPKNSRLELKKTQNALGKILPSWQDELQLALLTIKEGAS